MRYPGQVQMAIELFDELEQLKVPADKFMAFFFKKRRFIGSKDKGVIAEIVYTLYRRYGELSALIGDDVSARRLVLALFKFEGKKLNEDIFEIFTGEKYAPKKLSEGEKKWWKGMNFSDLSELDKLNIPSWIKPYLERAYGESWVEEVQALSAQAPADLRVNTLKTNIKSLQEALHSQADAELEETPYSPLCLRMESRKSLFATDAFQNGLFEIQDEGSQLIALSTGVKSGDTVVDFCAGAGGKTLALAAQMQNKGTIYACDIHEKRLNELPKRLKRAGVGNVRLKLLTGTSDKWIKRHKQTADVVLVDAPCSGTGTWRRSPDHKWRLQVENIDNLQKTQHEILLSASRLVKPEGVLVYATCSLLKEENEDRIEAFIKENKDFEVVNISENENEFSLPENQGNPFVRLSPAQTGTDGFFMALLRRKA